MLGNTHNTYVLFCLLIPNCTHTPIVGPQARNRHPCSAFSYQLTSCTNCAGRHKHTHKASTRRDAFILKMAYDQNTWPCSKEFTMFCGALSCTTKKKSQFDTTVLIIQFFFALASVCNSRAHISDKIQDILYIYIKKLLQGC